jgi:hypothetical protein
MIKERIDAASVSLSGLPAATAVVGAGKKW